MIWVFDLDEDQSRKQRVWAEIGFKVRVEFTMGVGIERRPRLGKDAGILFRRVAHCLHSRTQGIVAKLGALTGGPGWPAGPLIPIGPGGP